MPLVRSVPTRGPGAIKGLSAAPAHAPGNAVGIVKEVGHLTSAFATSLAVVVTGEPSGGNMLVLSCANVSGAVGPSVSSVTDSRGNTWTVDKTFAHPTSNNTVSVASTMQNVAPLLLGDTITVNLSAGSNNNAVVVHELFGVTNTVDTTASNSLTNTNRDAGTVTTTNASDLIWAAFALDADETTFVPEAGYSVPSPASYTFSTNATIEVEYQVVYVTGSYDSTGSGAGRDSAGASVAYKLAGGAAPIANTLTASPGTITITGSSTTLPVAHNPSVSPGTYTITGSSTTLPVSHKPTLSPGTYTITGSATTLPVAHKPTLSAGSYAITGSSTTLPVAHKPTVSPGSYAITGSPVTPPVAHAPSLAPGGFVISGASTVLVGPGPPVVTVINNDQSAYGSLWMNPY